MLNLRWILTGWFVLALAFSASSSRAEDQNVVSLTCRGMDVQKALTILRTVSALRIVVDPKVPHKPITLSFKDLPPEGQAQMAAQAGITLTPEALKAHADDQAKQQLDMKAAAKPKVKEPA